MNNLSPTPSLSITGLTIERPDGQLLLRDVSFHLNPGEAVLLVGPIGSGKSTLLRVLSGLQSNGQSGWKISGHLVTAQRTIDLSRDAYRAGAMVFQGNALFDDLTVAENLDISASHARGHSDAAHALASALMSGVPRNGAISRISGGERQLVAIARTMISDESILLFDEPNSGLDSQMVVRLAKILKMIKQAGQRPLLITAHHVEHLLPIADRIIFLDPKNKTLIETNGAAIEQRLCKTGEVYDSDKLGVAEDFALGTAVPQAGHRRSKLSWQWRFFRQYTWSLCFSPEALLYMGLGGLLVGFVTTWFTFKHFPQSNYLTPLFHEELLSGIGFVQFRILVPLMTAILLASRSAAIIASDLGHRVYSNQLDAMQNLTIPWRAYLGGNVLASSIAAAMVSIAFMFAISSGVSLTTWAYIFPEASSYLWKEHFFGSILKTSSAVPDGVGWIVVKTAASAIGLATASTVLGLSAKASVVDLNKGIAFSVVTTVALVLSIHTIVAFLEF